MRRPAGRRVATSSTAPKTPATRNWPHSARNGSALRLATRFQPACRTAAVSARTVASEHAQPAAGATSRPASAASGRCRRPRTACRRASGRCAATATSASPARAAARPPGRSVAVRHVGSAARSKHSHVAVAELHVGVRVGVAATARCWRSSVRSHGHSCGTARDQLAAPVELPVRGVAPPRRRARRRGTASAGSRRTAPAPARRSRRRSSASRRRSR